jgi:hypothetical protein
MKLSAYLVAALACTVASAQALDTKEVLLDVKWWGGGLNILGPGCSDPEKCVGSVAFKFEPFGKRFRAFVLANQGRRPYDAYNNRMRYPDDLRAKSSEGMWVEVDGANFIFHGSFTWQCVLKSAMRVDCSFKPQSGASYPLTVQPLVPGPSPTKWPE